MIVRTILDVIMLTFILLAIVRKEDPNRYLYWSIVSIAALGICVIHGFNHAWLLMIINAITCCFGILSARIELKTLANKQ